MRGVEKNAASDIMEEKKPGSQGQLMRIAHR